MAKNRGQTLHSLEELGETGLVPLPELPDIKGLTADEAVAEKIREGAQEIREWTAATLVKLEEVARASREARELAATAVAEAERNLKGFLSHETPAYRRASWIAVLTHRLSQELHSRTEVTTLLQELVKDCYLQESPEGALRAYGKVYGVPSDSNFGEPEVAEVKKVLANFLSRVWTAEREIRTQEAKDLSAQGELSLEDFRAGKPGKLVLGIPPEEVKGPNETVFWRGGGTLLVESNGERILPLAATGSIQGAIQEARELEVHLLVKSLEWEKPPFMRDLDPEKGKKVQLLWYLLQRGFRAEEEKRQRQAFKEKFATQATITPQEFFLEGKPGICLAESEEDWEQRSPAGKTVNRVVDPFFLVERFTQEEGEFVRLVEVPPHFKDCLAPCMGEHPEGEKFHGLPYPLVAVLQTVYGQVSKAAQINNK